MRPRDPAKTRLQPANSDVSRTGSGFLIVDQILAGFHSPTLNRQVFSFWRKTQLVAPIGVCQNRRSTSGRRHNPCAREILQNPPATCEFRGFTRPLGGFEPLKTMREASSTR